MSVPSALVYSGYKFICFPEFGSEPGHKAVGSVSHFFAAVSTSVFFDMICNELRYSVPMAKEGAIDPGEGK